MERFSIPQIITELSLESGDMIPESSKVMEFEESISLAVEDGARIIFIKEYIADKEDLFIKLAESLEFPDYFGYNWDAVLDLLSDFSWFDENEIIIVFLLIISPDLGDILKDISTSASSRMASCFQKGVSKKKVTFLFQK